MQDRLECLCANMLACDSGLGFSRGEATPEPTEQCAHDNGDHQRHQENEHGQDDRIQEIRHIGGQTLQGRQQARVDPQAAEDPDRIEVKQVHREGIGGDR